MRILMIVILLIPHVALATPVFFSKGCPIEVRERDEHDINSHFDAASNVVYIRVVKTKMDKHGIIDFQAEVVETFKGNLSGEIEIRSAWEIFDITTGGHYLFFLYDEKVIDHCNINIHLGQFPTNLYPLEYFVNESSKLNEKEIEVLRYLLGTEDAP